MVDKFFNLLGSIVVLAMLAVVAVHAGGVAQVTTSFFNGFGGSIKSAEAG